MKGPSPLEQHPSAGRRWRRNGRFSLPTNRGPVARTDAVSAIPRDTVAAAAHAVDLRKTYGTGQATVHALAGVDITFERGRFTAVKAVRLELRKLNPPTCPGHPAHSAVRISDG